jgi:hypothetical protein
MIFLQGKFCMGSCTLIFVCIILSAFYAYSVNARRAADDPEKKEFSPYSLWLTPIIIPLLIFADIFSLILSSLAFGFFLVLFPFALLLFRKPFLIKWILKQAQRVGNKLLKINTELLRAAGIYPTSTVKLQFER